MRGWALDPQGLGQVCASAGAQAQPGPQPRGAAGEVNLFPVTRSNWSQLGEEGDVSPASVSAWLHLPLWSSAGPCRGREASSHTLRCSTAPAPFPSLGCSSFENKILILCGTFLLSQAPKPASSELQALFKTPVGCFLIP